MANVCVALYPTLNAFLFTYLTETNFGPAEIKSVILQYVPNIETKTDSFGVIILVD